MSEPDLQTIPLAELPDAIRAQTAKMDSSMFLTVLVMNAIAGRLDEAVQIITDLVVQLERAPEGATTFTVKMLDGIDHGLCLDDCPEYAKWEKYALELARNYRKRLPIKIEILTALEVASRPLTGEGSDGT
jgi:hypothetical protein